MDCPSPELAMWLPLWRRLGVSEHAIGEWIKFDREWMARSASPAAHSQPDAGCDE